MKQPVQWCFDLTEIHDIMTVLSNALADEKKLVHYKHQLRNARDRLAELLEAFSLEAMETTHEREYLCLFDALSYLSDATRGIATKPRTLQAAFDELRSVFRVEVEV